jgi:hypothetical protein
MVLTRLVHASAATAQEVQASTVGLIPSRVLFSTAAMLRRSHAFKCAPTLDLLESGTQKLTNDSAPPGGGVT